MDKASLLTGAFLIVILAIAGAFIALTYGPEADWSKQPHVPVMVESQVNLGEIAFNPPAPIDAPEELRDTVMMGYRIMMNTKANAAAFVGKNNGLSCRHCHFDGGREKNTISLVGVAGKYPRMEFVNGKNELFTLEDRIGRCFEVNLDGKAPPPKSPELIAVTAYLSWISLHVPVYSSPPWLGLKPLQLNDQPMPDSGMAIMSNVCSRCHGPTGQGSDFAPPLAGTASFTTASSMYDLDLLSSFIHQFMPLRNPNLSEKQARNVAAFLRSLPRAQVAGLSPHE